MATIEREIEHKMELDAAKSAVLNIVEKLEANFGKLIKEIKWNEDKTAANVSGSGFKGNFNVDDKNVKIFIELGLLTSPFKGKVESEIDKYTAELNSKEA